MKKMSQSKLWLLAGSTLFFAFACQSNPNQNSNQNCNRNCNAPCSNPPNQEREWQNREQDRLDRRMEERTMQERTGGQPSYKGPRGDNRDDNGDGRSNCDPCKRIKKCNFTENNGQGEPERNRNRYRDRPNDNVSSDVMEEAYSPEEAEQQIASEDVSVEVQEPVAVDESVPEAVESSVEAEEQSVVAVPEVNSEEASPLQTPSETAQK